MSLVRIALVSGLSLCSTVANAQFTGASNSSDAGVTSVADFVSQCDLETDSGGGLLGGLVSSAIEGAKCDELEFTLKGNIVAHLGEDFYEFKDDTGKVNLQIRDFKGVEVGPDDTIRVSGDADYEDVGLVLEVDELGLAN